MKEMFNKDSQIQQDSTWKEKYEAAVQNSIDLLKTSQQLQEQLIKVTSQLMSLEEKKSAAAPKPGPEPKTANHGTHPTWTDLEQLRILFTRRLTAAETRARDRANKLKTLQYVFLSAGILMLVIPTISEVLRILTENWICPLFSGIAFVFAFYTGGIHPLNTWRRDWDWLGDGDDDT